MNYRLLLIIMVIFHVYVCSGFVFSTIGVGLSSIVAYLSKDKIMCIRECCHARGKSDWINYEPDLNSLSTNIFGQHIALNTVIKSLNQHLKNDKPPKALVLSFHGPTGVGKNFVSNLIAQSIYSAFQNKGHSKFVHLIKSTHFLLNNPTDRNKLKDRIKSGIESCERSLFIIDEVDKLPEGLLDDLLAYTDNEAIMDGLNYNKAIYLLLSNTGSDWIYNKTLYLRQEGRARESLTYKDFEMVLSWLAAKDGGLKNSELISRGVIDLFVPFLPLEKQHVKQCIVQYLRQHRNFTNPEESPGVKFIEEVADQMQYDSVMEIYSRFGCRRVRVMVDMFLET